jgi:hypothetical protein
MAMGKGQTMRTACEIPAPPAGLSSRFIGFLLARRDFVAVEPAPPGR